MIIQTSSLDNETIQAIQSSFKEKGHLYALEKYAIALEKLSQNIFIQPLWMALLYFKINQFDKAFVCLEKAYEMHNPNMPYIATDIWAIDQIRDDPRLIELLKKMNLPLSKKEEIK